jgi:hypothetical protein
LQPAGPQGTLHPKHQPEAPLRCAACRALPQLRRLSLRRCMFLQGGFLGSLGPVLTQLRHLDLAGCGLGLHLNQGLRAALGAMAGLTDVDLSDGNGVTDEALRELARLPRLG